MKRAFRWSGLAVVTLLIALPAAAQTGSPRPVVFPPGKQQVVLSSRLKGDQDIDYKVEATAGQTLAVTLTSRNPQAYFNILPPGSQDVATFVGSSEGNRFSGTLPTAGAWTIRVYLMRAAARRGEGAPVRLAVRLAGTSAAAGAAVPAQASPSQASARLMVRDGRSVAMRAAPSLRARAVMEFAAGYQLVGGACKPGAAAGWCQVWRPDEPEMRGYVRARDLVAAGAPASDALVPGTRYHATGDLFCAAPGAKPKPRCPFGVVRGGPGRATVTVRRPDAASLDMVFENNKVTAVRGATDFKAERRNDSTFVTVGGLVFDIPDAVINGG